MSALRARRLHLLVLLLGTTIAFVALPFPADANPHGIVGYTSIGAICHDRDPTPDVRPVLEGLPERWSAGASYAIVITVRGGPPMDLSKGGHAGGFNLRASAGDLEMVDGNTLRSIRGGTWHDMTQGSHAETPFAEGTWGELTFSHIGANERSWEARWKAPKRAGEGDVTFALAGLSANGDHRNTPDDQWNLATYSVQEGEPLGFTARYGTLLVGALAVSAVVGLVYAGDRWRRAYVDRHASRQERRHKR